MPSALQLTDNATGFPVAVGSSTPETAKSGANGAGRCTVQFGSVRDRD